MTLTLVIFGILSSVLTEVISFVEKKLSGTPYQGYSAKIVIMFVSLLGGALYVVYKNMPSATITTILAYASAIYATAEVYYLAIGHWYATKSS